MSDHIKVLGRWLVSKPLLACFLYAGITILTAFQAASSGMTREAWDEMWWMPRAGWWCGIVIPGLAVIKAFFSNSSKKEELKA